MTILLYNLILNHSSSMFATPNALKLKLDDK